MIKDYIPIDTSSPAVLKRCTARMKGLHCLYNEKIQSAYDPSLNGPFDGDDPNLDFFNGFDDAALAAINEAYLAGRRESSLFYRFRNYCQWRFKKLFRAQTVKS